MRESTDELDSLISLEEQLPGVQRIVVVGAGSKNVLDRGEGIDNLVAAAHTVIYSLARSIGTGDEEITTCFLSAHSHRAFVYLCRPDIKVILAGDNSLNVALVNRVVEPVVKALAQAPARAQSAAEVHAQATALAGNRYKTRAQLHRERLIAGTASPSA